MAATPQDSWSQWLLENKTHLATAAFAIAMWAAKYYFKADDSTMAMLVGVGAAFGISAHKSDVAQTAKRVTGK